MTSTSLRQEETSSTGAHLVDCLIYLWVNKVVRVDTKDLSDIDVGAAVVDLGVVGNEGRVGDTIRLLDPFAGATCQQSPRSSSSTETDRRSGQKRGHDSLVSNNSVDLCAVVSLDTETDLRVGHEVVTVFRDGGLVDEGELVCRNTVFMRCMLANPVEVRFRRTEAGWE